MAASKGQPTVHETNLILAGLEFIPPALKGNIHEPEHGMPLGAIGLSLKAVVTEVPSQTGGTRAVTLREAIKNDPEMAWSFVLQHAAVPIAQQMSAQERMSISPEEIHTSFVPYLLNGNADENLDDLV
jgi:hypothetical protein